jgi:glutamyl-tRNA synthetase
MDGSAHKDRADDVLSRKQPLERLAAESVEPRPQAHVRCGRPLRLEPGHALESRDDSDTPPLEQQLAREGGPIQLPHRQRPHPAYAIDVSVVVRMAPSPTGFLHIGGVRTFLFNWLFARQHGGENRLRIENTDTTREVAEAVDQIKQSLSWIGIEWDGEPTFQLDRMDDCRKVAEQLVADGKAYEDDGAIRFRMPDEGVTAWDDMVRGRVEFENAKLADPVIVRSDGRPIYNFASPLEDVWDGITHVIRGDDHISNTPTQINIIRAVAAELPVYAHVPNIFGQDGKKLSKRHGATGIDEFRAAGYLPETMLNFLALLGWAPDGETTLMRRDELIERFSLERVSSSPAQFDYAKLDWMNGVYLRELALEDYAHRLVLWLGENGYAWDAELVARTAPLVQEKIAKLSEYPAFAGFFFGDATPSAAELEGGGEMLAAADEALATLEPFDAQAIEAALRAAAEKLELKPRQAFQPIRVAVTGSKVSPGLFESIELLGREETLSRVRAAAAAT